MPLKFTILHIAFFLVSQLAVSQEMTLQTLYNPDSTIRSEGFVNAANLKQGNWTYYDKQGNVLQMGRFVNDKRTGVWLVYDEKSNVVMKPHMKMVFLPACCEISIPARNSRVRGKFGIM
jgi:hypothetical protein